MSLAIIGFVLMIILMYVLIREKLSPIIAFIILPLIAAIVAGFGITEIAGFIETGMETMLSTVILFAFSISYFSLMSEVGLFDPIINFLVKKTGKNMFTIFMAIVMVTFVAHLDGSGATTFLIVVPAFLPICKKYGIRPQALLGAMMGAFATMNILPWGGPTMRAATVANVETGDLYSFMIPAVIVIILIAFCIAYVVYLIEKKNGAGIIEGSDSFEDNAVAEKTNRNQNIYWFNLILTAVMLILLFMDLAFPLYAIFMIAFAIALVVNFPNVKDQSKKIKLYGTNAMVMCMTLFAVGVFMGVISGSGMVEAMATAIVNILPAGIAPHMHWFMALFSVPLMMMLGTDAFYYALLPIIIGVVEPFGVSPEVVAATFLLTATFGTFVSPSVAAVYVGLGLAEVSIGDHIKYSLRLVWPVSILVLILSTIIGVIKF
ncbi:CitMHS family transporter [Candidatus Epulonipiscium viviparus]|uniref:CitMHS family transporter n=1 Tax=Candidatus Epulonipiscium viviparus TaxID=420336 RepID=UPI0027380D72|nr:citrate:proton symporter [Candidatus Epulopiscium viviparus]